jgi:hypothetical protein
MIPGEGNRGITVEAVRVDDADVKLADLDE